MYNLLLSLAIAAAAFILGWLGANTWVGGFVPAVLAAIVAYVLLARRSGRQMEALNQRATAEFDTARLEKLMATAQKLMAAGQRNQAEAAFRAFEDLKKQQIEKMRTVLNEGFALAKWQFLVSQQLHGQIGAYYYMEGRYAEARPHLEQAWSRNWMAMTQLAALDFREDHKAQALARLEKTTGPGEKEALFWGVYAWIALESGDKERALKVAGQGAEKVPSNAGLKAMLDALRNQKKIKVQEFGESWYNFFPEHFTEEQQRARAEQIVSKSGYRPPQPKPGRMR